jgi:hypothetical protein|tara:strand:+ start:199 stop:879 length:681 start_codon:yes stop_codon:yes gene_type:complete
MTSARTIAAIPCTYHGIKFRSRLEARWAMFFHRLGLHWEYEPEGFFLGKDGEYDSDLMYLPDFLVITPQGKDMWYEIKPINITEDEKFTKFCHLLHKPKNKEEEEEPWLVEPVRVMLLSGQPKDVLKKHIICPRCGYFVKKDFGILTDHVYCWECDRETPSGANDELEKNSVLRTPCLQHKGDILIGHGARGVEDDYRAFEKFHSRYWDIADACRRYRFYQDHSLE